MSIAHDKALDERIVQIGNHNVYVAKLNDDPLCLRVSLGGFDDEGYYCTFRGPEEEIQNLLERALEAFKQYRRGNA